MAKHVPFGRPVNAAERWAFDFLKRSLPDEYEVYTNVELIGDHGEIREVDAIVIGDRAVYLIDVKGYAGEILAGKDVWLSGTREVNNPLPKIRALARSLAGRMRKRTFSGMHVPWCEGLAFVTGREGRGLDLQKLDPDLPVYDRGGILAALTDPERTGSSFSSVLTSSQRELARDAVGQVSLVQLRNNRIRDYHKSALLDQDGGIKVWTADYRLDEISVPFILKVVDLTATPEVGSSELASQALFDEFRTLQTLAGTAGVPYVAPLIDDGESLVLPIRRPRGLPIELVDWAEKTEEEMTSAALSMARSLAGIHSRGIIHGRISSSNLWVTEQSDVEFLDIGRAPIRDGGTAAPELATADTMPTVASDVFSLAVVLRDVMGNDSEADEGATGNPSDITWQVRSWITKATDEDPESRPALLELIAAIRRRRDSGQSPDVPAVEFTPEIGAVIDGRYRLEELIEDEGESTIWKARHVVGRFPCYVRVVGWDDPDFDDVAAEFSEISRLHHPALAPYIDMGLVPGSRFLFVTAAWMEGTSLRRHVGLESCDEQVCAVWIRRLLEALQYVHSFGLVHRNINPDTILVHGDGAALVDIWMSALEMGTVPKNSYRLAGEQDPEHLRKGDLYSICQVFLEVLVGKTLNPETPTELWPDAMQVGLSKKLAEIILVLLDANIELAACDGYLVLFGLEDVETHAELPLELADSWGISRGYMTFLVLDMINDGRARSRKQWVLNALRSRGIPGNRINRSSMSSTVSALKSRGVVEYHRTKVRLSNEFAKDWERHVADR